MTKYLEQRVEELEKEVRLLKARFKLEENKANSTSKYLNNYSHYGSLKSYYDPKDNMYNSSANLMSVPNSETAFATPYKKEGAIEAPLVSLTVPSHTDSDFNNYQMTANPEIFSTPDSDFPSYPDIIDSWDKNSDDIIDDVDEYGYKLNYKPKTATAWGFSKSPGWGFTSEFDKMDKDFLKWLKEDGKRIFEESKLKANTITNNNLMFEK